jgi:hypothetical protein
MKIGKRNPKLSIPQVGDRVAITQIAHRGLRPLLGEFATVEGLGDDLGTGIHPVHLVMDREIDNKKVHTVYSDDVLFTMIGKD